MLSNRAKGKHIGHACEGHLRGLLTHLQNVVPERVGRQLPFDFHVEPDVVLLNASGRVRAVLIVAYWANADNSHMKYYRTRSEYKGVVRAHKENPDDFADDFVLATVIYGSPDGWKEQILLDLADQCAPLLFLPNELGAVESTKLVERAFEVYRSLWEAGEKDVREAVETHFAQTELTASESNLLNVIRDVLSEGAQHDIEGKVRERTSANVPSEPFRTRLRQALGALSVFNSEEIDAWLEDKSLDDEKVEAFARRAAFLDLGTMYTVPTMTGPEIEFDLRKPVRQENGKERYAPDLPDFTDWTRLEKERVEKILAKHRKRTTDPTSVFRGGAYDQIAGNWKDICKQVRSHMPDVIQALEQNSKTDFVQVLCQESPVTAPDWHPAKGEAGHFPLWAFTVCALAIEKNSRSVRSKRNYHARRQEDPAESEAAKLFAICQSEDGVPDRLKELTDFSKNLLEDDLSQLGQVERPLLLSLDEPCSWIADFYNTLTTNSSHNPLNEVVYEWLKHTYPEYKWHGWPNRRSRALNTVLGPTVSGRREWQFIGVDSKSEEFCAAEIKSITQNNWGNKSKELYDRVAEAREAAYEIGWAHRTILVFDGDMERDQLDELETGIGHDEVVSINDVIDIVFEYELL